MLLTSSRRSNRGAQQPKKFSAGITKVLALKDGCFAELKELKYRIDLSYGEYKIESAYKIVTENGEEFTIQEAASNNTAKIDSIGGKWILTE